LTLLAPLTLVALAVLAWLVLLWALARWWLCGPDLRAFDRASGPHFLQGTAPSAEHQQVVASLGQVRRLMDAVPPRQRLALLRQHLDSAFTVHSPGTTFEPANADGVRAEWVAPPGADTGRRLLYIHGGGFIVGSPQSHRRLTTRLAELTGGVVLAIDYRLMPEHSRGAGIEDCRRAYRWLLANGPGGTAAASKVWIAGDSAGGNLALSLIAWVRDSGLRAPDAAVAFSPTTDATLASPSLRARAKTDAMLGPVLAPLLWVPRSALLWATWLYTRINPRDPVVSPVYGDLSRLPPVLVQVSSAEMLHDDARRYVNRAVAAGSPVQLQTWAHMVHVWQIFHPELPEGRAALEEVGRFLAQAPVSKPD
jgi:epsilon-lactone hydrolase